MDEDKRPDAKLRGFDPGDDDKLQKAMLKNLEKSYEAEEAAGDTDAAKDAKAELNALEEIEKIDEKIDPEDKNPDDPDMK